MSTQTQAGASPAPQQTKPAEAMSDFEKLLTASNKSRMDFKAFGSEDTVSLSVELVKTHIAAKAKGRDAQNRDVELMPDDLSCRRFIMLCKARRLNPWEGDAFMVPFFNTKTSRHEWSLITAHQAFVKRAENHPEYNGKESGVIVMDADNKIQELPGDFVPDGVRLIGGWCRIHYKTRQFPEYQRLKLSTYAKNYGHWLTDPAGMICKCAEAAGYRTAFPTLCGGMYLREEMAANPDFAELLNKPSKPLFDGAPTDTTAAVPTPEPPSPEREPEPEPEPEPELPRAKQNGGGTKPQPPPAPAANPAPAAAPQAAPTQAAPEPAPVSDKPIYNYVRAVRLLCRSHKLKESDLLSFLVEINSADQCATLEELQLQEGGEGIIKMVHDQFKDIAARILPTQKGGTNE